MNETPKYDLLPLSWWENPWNVGFIILFAVLMVVGVFVVIRFLIQRKKKSLHPIDQWRLDLQLIKQALHSRQCPLQHGYDEMVRIIREYAHTYYVQGNISHTDEEFVQHLKNGPVAIPERFLLLVQQVSSDAYQVKFANILFALDYVDHSLDALIDFLEQEKNKINISLHK